MEQSHCAQIYTTVARSHDLHKDIMTALSQAIVVEAAIAVNRMDVSKRLSLADEIFAQQPNLLASVLVLQRMGASLKQMDVPLCISCWCPIRR